MITVDMRRLLVVSAVMGMAICTLVPTFLVVAPMEVDCTFVSVIKSEQSKHRQNYILPYCLSALVAPIR